MIQFPNGKINLGLHVVARRPDGFHDIESVMYPVPLCDALEIIPAPGDVEQFHSTGLAIPGGEEHNLCVRAYRLLRDEFRIPTVKMHLHKVIPMGSGLGGGSSDGAFTLKMLNELFGLGLDIGHLQELARSLGSDCPFFIRNQPQFVYGKGDQAEPVTVDLSGFYLGLVIPDIHISTADAYRMVAPTLPTLDLKQVVSLPPDQWKDRMTNDFERPVFEKYSAVSSVKQRLYQAGAIYSSMTGSGSAVYGLFEKNIGVKGIFPGCFTWTAQLP